MMEELRCKSKDAIFIYHRVLDDKPYDSSSIKRKANTIIFKSYAGFQNLFNLRDLGKSIKIDMLVNGNYTTTVIGYEI